MAATNETATMENTPDVAQEQETTEAVTTVDVDTSLPADDDMSEEEMQAMENMEDEEDDVDDNGLTPEENKMLEQLLAKSSFRAHKVMKAKKSAKKAMFRDENVITESEDAVVETESTMLRNDMVQLAASAQAKRVLEGKIIGVRTANPNSKVATNLAEVSYGYGTCTVLIPDYLLFNYNIENYRTPDGQVRVKNRIVEMIGTNVKFIVKQFDQRTKTAYADRLKAMEQEAYNNYIRNLNATGKPRIKVGDKVQARVTAVGRNYVTVYALGSECNILQNARRGEVEVSWNHLPDCRTQFKKNQLVNVRVLDINVEKTEKYSEEYTLVATKLSIKQTQEDPQEKYFDEFVEEGFYQGVVSSVAEHGVYVILNGKVDCLCSFPKFGELPYVGQERVVQVTLKTTEDSSGNAKDQNGKPIKRIFGIFKDM